MCILCKAWDNTEFAKRPTTDLTTTQAKGVMNIGYWLGVMSFATVESGKFVAPPLCARHEDELRAIIDPLAPPIRIELAQTELPPPAPIPQQPQSSFPTTNQRLADVRQQMANVPKPTCHICRKELDAGGMHLCEEVIDANPPPPIPSVAPASQLGVFAQSAVQATEAERPPAPILPPPVPWAQAIIDQATKKEE